MQTWQVVSRLCSRCLTVIKYSRRPSHKYGRTDRQPKAKPIRQGCVTSLQLPHHHQTVQLCRYNSWVPWQLPASAPYVRWYSVVNEASWDGDNFPFMSSWNNIDCHIILGRCVSPHDAKDNMWVQCMTPGGHSALAKQVVSRNTSCKQVHHSLCDKQMVRVAPIPVLNENHCNVAGTPRGKAVYIMEIQEWLTGVV